MRKNGNGYTSHFNKYKNHRTEIDGIVFASSSEAQYYVDMRELQLMGVVEKIERQVKYEIQPAFVKNGVKFGKIDYVADFRITYQTGVIEIVEIKGFETDVWKLKHKLFEYKYPDLTIKVINSKNKRKHN